MRTTDDTHHKRDTEAADFDDLVSRFERRVRVCTCNCSSETVTEVGVCWAWLEQSHPTIYDGILHHGTPNGTLFRAYVSNVYRGIRLVRPDLVASLGTVDSIVGNCRAFRRIVDMFPCLF